MKEKHESSTIATNRKARRDYFIMERFEAGIALCGTEVKSIRNRRVSINDAFVRPFNGEIFIYNMNISHYEQGNRNNHEPLRERKLLMHGKEILYLAAEVERKGFAIVPLSLYFKKNIVKVEIALAKGKKEYDRREDIKRREDERSVRRVLRNRYGR